MCGWNIFLVPKTTWEKTQISREKAFDGVDFGEVFDGFKILLKFGFYSVLNDFLLNILSLFMRFHYFN